MKRGDSPLGPPPLGRVVSLAAARMLLDTGAQSRKAIVHQYQVVRKRAVGFLTLFQNPVQVLHILQILPTRLPSLQSPDLLLQLLPHIPPPRQRPEQITHHTRTRITPT